MEKEQIKEKIDELLENSETDEDDNVCFEDEDDQKKYDFWSDLLDNCGNENEFISFFRDNMPDSFCWEDLPAHKKQHEYLDAIFDAFEEIIRRFSNCA